MSSRRLTRVFARGTMLAAVSLTMACGGSDAGDLGSDAHDRRRAPITMSGDDAPIPSGMVVEVLRLGDADREGPELFGEIRALAVAPDGDILIFDHFGNELRRFDAVGRYISSSGGTGEGPGEFLNVVGLAIDPAGDTWVVDVRNRRYSVVGEDSVLRVLARPSRVVTQPWVGGFDREGFLHDLATESGGPRGELEDRLLRMDEGGTVVSEHGLPRVAIPTPTLGLGVMVPIPYLPQLLRAWDPAGAVWQAISTDYSIVRINLAGDTTHVVAVDRSGPPLNAAERDSLRSAVAAAERSFGIHVAADMTPSRIALLRWMAVDDQGNLWVCATARSPCDEIEVHEVGGGAHRKVSLPVPLLDHPVPLIHRGLIYGATEGPLGVPQLFVGKLPPP